jgi:hypothetical protein
MEVITTELCSLLKVLEFKKKFFFLQKIIFFFILPEFCSARRWVISKVSLRDRALPEVLQDPRKPKNTSGVNVIKLFASLLMMRPNKLEHLSLETLSSQVLELEGKDRANQIGAPFIYCLLG